MTSGREIREIDQSVVVAITVLSVHRPLGQRVDVRVIGVLKETDAVDDGHVRRMPESGIGLRHPAVLEGGIA